MDCYTRLQVYCNIALRVCFRVKDPTDCAVKELYKRAKMLPLDLRRIYFQLSTCHRLVYAGKMNIPAYSACMFCKQQGILRLKKYCQTE